MNPRHLKFLTGALLAVAALWLWLLAARQAKPGQRPWKELEPAAVAVVDLTRGTETIRIFQTEAGWRLLRPFSAPANQGQVTGLLDSLKNLEIGEVVSRSVDVYPDLGMDTTNLIELRLHPKPGRQAGPERVFLGRDAASGGEMYLRWPQEKEIRLASGLERGRVEPELLSWADRYVVRPDTAALASFAVFIGRKTLRFHRDPVAASTAPLSLSATASPSASAGWEWKINGRPADSAKVEGYLSSLRNLYADSLEPLGEGTYSGRAEYTVEVVDPSTRTFYLWRPAPESRKIQGGGKPDLYLAASPQERLIWRIASWRVQPLFRSATEFVKTN